MKQFEELARIRVNEAIQNGLRAQQIHRALAERRKDQSIPVNLAVVQGPLTLKEKVLQLTTLFNKIHHKAVLAITKEVMFLLKIH